ncbi:MAG: hemolysin family protein [Acidobacteriota bacterium]|nr:MAG: HlyC/CorC family transporter [Acidobacteriota bacterium]
MHDIPHQSPGTIVLAIVAAIVLVVANAGFVAAEFALVKVRPARLEALAAAGSRRARSALWLARRLDETLSVCQVGITLTSLGLGWLGEPAFGVLFERLLAPAEPWLGALSLSVSVGFAFFTITFLHVVLGELVPKTLAIQTAERVSLAIAWPLRAFRLAAWPLVVLLNGSAQVIMRVTRVGQTTEASAHSRDEIRQLVAASMAHGALSAREADLLDNLFHFSERQAGDVMVPRSRVVALDADAPLDDVLATVREEAYSRYPVYRGSLDEVVGVLHVKDLFAAIAGGRPDGAWARLARRPVLIPGTMTLERLLRRFQLERTHLAIVLDEYGGVAGIVTLEDVLEELVGELRDEFDSEEVDEVRPRPGGGYILDPVVAVDRVVSLVDGAPEVPDEVRTVAGLMQAALGRLPEAGDRVPFGKDHELVATAVDGTRIQRIELVPASRTTG